MKALLYNRFCHWGWAETPDTFRRWYESIDYTNVKATERNNDRKPKAQYNPLLIGAIIGDIVGSIYEFNPHKSKDINLLDSSMEYTDDTIMTIAVADWILNDKKHSKKGLVRTLWELMVACSHNGYLQTVQSHIIPGAMVLPCE